MNKVLVMKTEKKTLKFQIDIVDFDDDKHILETIENLLKVSRDQEFIDNIFLKKGRGISIRTSPNISIVFSQCNCD